MNCALSPDKQKNADIVIAIAIKTNPISTPEEILRKIYDYTYEEYIKVGASNKDAIANGLAITLYAAERLYQLLSLDETSDLRKNFLSLLSKDNTFTAETIENYKKVEELKKLVGVKDLLPEPIISNVKREQVQVHLDKIKTSFPQSIVQSKVKYKDSNNPRLVWNFSVIKTQDGNIRLPEVTDFVRNNTIMKNGLPNKNTTDTRIGTIADFVVRQFIKAPSSFEDFNKKMLDNKEFMQLFGRFFEDSDFSKLDISSKVLYAYAENFLNDMAYAINYIQNEYKDYYLTDLSELIDKSGLPEEAKNRFWLYSDSIGLKGELDLLAISPDGKFKVIDIKTVTGEKTENEKDKYHTQASVYDLLIEKFTGLKSEGVNDIIILNKYVNSPSSLIKHPSAINKQANSGFKASIVSVSKDSKQNNSKDDLIKKIEDFREELFKKYDKEIKVEAAQNTGAIPWTENMIRGRLRMRFLENEPLSTSEDLQQGITWLTARFPEIANKINIIRVINSNKGGEFFLDSIDLYEKSNKGVAYHEGFHRFSQLYLTKEERENYYTLVRSKSISYTSRDGRELNTKDSNNLNIEEFLAEEFRKYALNPEKYKFPKDEKQEVKGIFNKIWAVLKALYSFFKGNGDSAFTELFKNLYTGSFNKANFSIQNAEFDNLNSFFRSILDNTTFLKYRNYVDIRLNEYLTRFDITISDLLDYQGIKEIENVTRTSLQNLKDDITAQMNILVENKGETAGEIKEQERKLENLYDSLEDLEKILEQNLNGDFVNMPDFMRGYFKTSRFQTLRKFVGKNTEQVNKLVHEASLQEEYEKEIQAEEEEFDDENPTAKPEGEELKYDQSGNEKKAIDQARDELKDFFTGYKRRKNSDLLDIETVTIDDIKYDNSGIPEIVSREEAFNKTLEILQGSLSIENMIKRIKDSNNRLKFPELIFIEERLLGKKDGNEGLIPKFERITKELEEGNDSNLKEFIKVKNLLLHFTHVLSMRNVDFLNVAIRLNTPKDTENNPTTEIVTFRKSLELVINNIIGNFTKGFQKNSLVNYNKKKTNDETDEFVLGFQQSRSENIMDIMYRMYVKESTESDIVAHFRSEFRSLSYTSTIHDNTKTTFYFNPLYASTLVTTSTPTVQQLRSFFNYIGININDNAFESQSDLNELNKQFIRLKNIFDVFAEKSVQNAVRNYGNTALKDNLINWKKYSELIPTLEEGTSQRTKLEIELNSIESILRGYSMSIFTPDPINQMLFDGQDRKLMKVPENRVFATNRSVFENIAKVEKKYHKKFSSGSMLVLDGLQYSYFLHNQMLIIETLINEHINHYDDFIKYPELNHLDPRINPQIKNSWIFKLLFDENGNKKDGARLNIQNIAQISVINEETGEIEAKAMSELREEEKLLFDYIMVRKHGFGEIRRLETSNTAYALSFSRNGEYIRPVRLSYEGFNQPTFLGIIRGYIQHSADKYKVYKNTDLTDLKENNKELLTLGVWEEMLGKSISNRIKSIVDSYKGDMNDLFKYIEKNDNGLFNEITNSVIKYFDDITLNNKDSYKNALETKLSDKSRNILEKLNYSLSDENLRDFIANDFIMAMEDSIIFFGDYTYYKDPSKRRKIMGNNGSINMVGGMMERAIKAEAKINSLNSVYQKAKGITSSKDHRLVSKIVLNDIRIKSSYLEEDSSGKTRMIEDLRKVREQGFGLKQTYEQVKESKLSSIEIFSKMEIANAAAWISLDMFRQMHQREQRWSDLDEMEYKRQMLILKDKLDPGSLTEEEQLYISKNYSFFNVSKFATTGATYDENHKSMQPTFDKMGLRVLLPETDWNTTMRPIFEYMMENDIDYVVNDNGSKGFMSKIHDAFNEDGSESIFDKSKAVITRHAGGWFKNQLNTYGTKDKTTLSSQLRGIFFEIMLIQEKYGKISPSLKKAYQNLIKNLTDYILVNSSTVLSEMGLDKEGNIKDQPTFVNYIRNRLEKIETVSKDLTDLLSTNLNGTLSTYLEALPFQSDIGNLISGIIDDNLRKIKLNGSKMFQTPEMGTTLPRGDRKLDKSSRGTLELKWHEVQWDENGNAISTSPVESKVAFKQEQWGTLLTTVHPDGDIIAPKNSSSEYKIKRLNEAIKDEVWLSKYKDSITFIGVRIPLQDINFTSHMIIKEFLPEVAGDMIILPAEFYMQTGGDNDIDTITATFKYLNEKGKVISRPAESYTDIIDQYNEVSKRIADKKREDLKLIEAPIDIQAEINILKEEFIANNIYDENGNTSDIDEDFTINGSDGQKYFAGQLNSKSVLYNIVRKGKNAEQVQKYLELLDKINKSNKSTTNDEDAKLLNNLVQKRNIYIKGITNNIISAFETFMKLPENYDFLTETDNIRKIKILAAKTLTMKGKPTTADDLGKSNSPLVNIGYIQNLLNHKNNSEIRSILGSVVKFRRVLTTLAEMKMTLNTEYNATSITNLIAKYFADEDMNPLGELLGDTAKPFQKSKLDKSYKRIIRTPLLYNKDTVAGIEMSIFDENGERITKNLSMLTSSLLDLFKNADVFPSLGITWLEVKYMIFLIAQGVPLERVILFINNPIAQEIQKNLYKLGTDVQDRHALVYTSQELFGDTIHKNYDKNLSKDQIARQLKNNKDKVYAVKVPDENGNLTINKMMRRHGEASEKFLSRNTDRNSFRFTEQQLEDFTVNYANYLADPKVASFNKNLKEFMNRFGLEDLGKQILAYYSTLLEDGDLFYKFFVKAINRDSNKHNNISSISNAEMTERAREASGMTNKKFNKQLREETTQSPFYQDKLVMNLIANRMPEVLKHKNIKFRNRFIKSIQNITNAVYSRSSEERTKVEEKVLSDWLDFLYKNFYVLSFEGKLNTPYEYFEYDITPLLRKITKGYASIQDMIKNISVSKHQAISEDDRIQALYNDTLFPNQIDHIRVKYPELMNLKIFQELIKKMIPGKESNRLFSSFEFKDHLNILEQNYIYLNLSSDPNERMVDEEMIRDEWRNLVTFNISSFSSIKSEIIGKDDRLAVYNNPENIAEISNFATLLAHYAMTQSSHLNVARGAFSRLMPSHILKNIVESSINNFNKFIDTLNDDNLNNMMNQFELMFKDMNGELKWQNKQEPDAEKVEDYEEGSYSGPDTDYVKPPRDINDPYWKAQTGKLYSKIENQFLSLNKTKLLLAKREEIISEKEKELGRKLSDEEKNKIERLTNNFVINIFDNTDNDPLNCAI